MRCGYGRCVLSWLAGAALVAASACLALGQETSGSGVATPKLPEQGGASASVPSISTTGSGEVQLKLERFGMGGLCRPGDWTGLKVQFMDSAPKPREIIVRVAGLDPDGDTPLYQRELTTNPATWQSAWMYVRLPYWFGYQGKLTLTVNEALEGGEGGGFTAGRLLGTLQLEPSSPQSVTEASTALMAVVGNSGYGLGRYSTRLFGEPWLPTGHEVFDIAPRLTPEDIPDRWQGLASYELLVWGAGDPGELRGDRAKAVREWVERGGHLVVVLPPVGETWTNRLSNELYDLLPAVRIVRQEGVDLEPYRPLLTRKKPSEAQLPKNAVVHELAPVAEASVLEAAAILNGPDGKCVVARRQVGAGAVTLVGIDASQRALVDLDLLDADVFWNRVLGRRGSLLTTAELKEKGDQLQAKGASLGSRSKTLFDADIGREIAKTGRSATGVLMGVALFVVYWAIAGPVGYAVLKRKGVVRHSWVGYLGAAAAFTAIAWGGATILRPARVEASHLTFIDHVFGQPVQRSRTWASVLIPRYGNATLSVGEPSKDDSKRRATNLIAAFDPPWSEAAGAAMFPDTRGYVVDTRRPDSITAPTRATVKQIQADWVGGPRWDMPRPVWPKGMEKETAAKIELGPNRQLSGILVHKLPAALEHVILMVNYGQRPLSVAANGDSMWAQVSAYKLDRWNPDEPLDLATLVKAGGSVETYLENLVGAGSELDSVTNKLATDVGSVTERLNAIAFFPQFAPPDFRSQSMFQGMARGPAVAMRAATHGWDLGRWFAQPCVIIVGQVGASGGGEASPTPIYLDGEPVKSKGRTVVRWVYPLEAAPPRYPEENKGEAKTDGAAGAGDAKGGS